MTQKKKTAPPGEAQKKKMPMSERVQKVHILKNHLYKKMFLGTMDGPAEEVFLVQKVYDVGFKSYVEASKKSQRYIESTHLDVSTITSIRKEKAKRYLFKKS